MFPTLILSQTFVSQSIFYNLFKHSNFDGLYDARPLEESALRQKCPNTEYFLVRGFLYSFRIQENMNQKKLCIWIIFTQCKCGI